MKNQFILLRILNPIFILLSILCSQVVWTQGVTIGSNNPPDPSAVLDLQSSTGGFALPRLTTAQRNAIQNPALGLQIYNTTTECLQVYHVTGWKDVSCSCNQPPQQPGVISGPTQVCAGQMAVVYSILSVPSATSYQWTLPPGATISSAPNDTSIVVNFTSGTGNISVTASNYCGVSAAQSITVAAQNPSAAFTVTPSQPVFNSAAQFSASSAGLTYAWTFSGGTPASSILQNPSVTWASTGTYPVQLIVTDANGCSDTILQQIIVTNCPPPGSNTITFNYTGSVQTWTVPTCVTSIRIRAFGAQGGGNTSYNVVGGLGARMEGDFSVTPGEQLYIIVGKQGEVSIHTGGGGGGSGVVRSNGTPMLIAGGGGGLNQNNSSSNMNGTTSQNGQVGTGSSLPAAGTNGGDGGTSIYSGAHYAYGGRGFNSGFMGTTGQNGQSGSTQTTQGTFGLGGGGGSVGSGYCNCGGGGGGYSGGSAGGVNGSGGGGGSYNAGSNQSNSSGVNNGDGSVVIIY